MSAMKWTPEQQEGITYTGENILLAAAAGSGKTAVLSERVIQKILTQNVNIDELLILTFTEKTAAEMKAKISEKINKVLLDEPGNAHLRRQAIHINRANISTIHSFCLEIIKNNIHLTNIPAGFAIGSENECDILKGEALTETLDKAFGAVSRRADVAALFDGYGNGRDDKDIRKIILDLHRFSRNLPRPNRWLIESLQTYKKTAETGELDANMLEQFKEMVRFYLSGDSDLLLMYEDMPNDSYGEIINSINALKELKNGRSKVMPKAKFGELYDLTSFDAESSVGYISKTVPALSALVKLVIAFERRYKRKKLERNMLDFNDLEHEMLRLLLRKSGERTPLAAQLSKRYCEILIDEYQDINSLQNEIFTAISRDDRNIFMVGDIKQSIYQFRGAVPTLFLERYHAYKHEDSQGRLIKLYKNFRSRDNIIDFANFIFRAAMSATVGDVNYTADEELIRGAEYPLSDDRNNNLTTEVYTMVDIKTEKNDGENYVNRDESIMSTEATKNSDEDLEKIDREAIFAAKRIREIIDNKEVLVTDKVSGELRPATYRDFAILSRSVKGGIAKSIEQQLFAANIPAYADVGESYLDKWEVATILSFLQIIDNPLQDIPLIAVLRSVMFGFEPDELAEIRLCNKRKNMPFYIALTEAADGGSVRCMEFIAELEQLRDLSAELGVDQLIWHIYERFGFYEHVKTLQGGERMQANLRLLFERAGEFQQSRFKGLFSFNHFINTLIAEGRDLSLAKIVSESENVARIMSIHTSKGLEFPIVIMLSAGKTFFTQDITHPKFLWHADCGIGGYYIDPARRVQYPSVARDVVAFWKRKDMISEEMRLLYVAITRAKEKLLIIGTPDRHFESRQAKISFTIDDKLSPYSAATAKSHLDWIVPVVESCPFAEFREVNINDSAEFAVVVGGGVLDAPQSDEAVEENYEDFVYPYGHLNKIPVKLSVSEIKRQQMAEDDVSVPYFTALPGAQRQNIGEAFGMQSKEEERRCTLCTSSDDDAAMHQNDRQDLVLSTRQSGYTPPKLEYQTAELSGVQRGVITHFVMQHLDERNVGSVEEIREQLAKMVRSEMLTNEQAGAVDVAAVARFFESPLGLRVRAAREIQKEVKFYMKVPAAEILPELSNYVHSGEEILVQGVVDCYFVENGKLVIIDYKTDKVSDNSVFARAKEYKTALEYYARGLAEILEMEVGEKYLYFFENNMLINVDNVE
ncbi:MAG: UvrD-helicase domain-containing protein [Oscillospiraceae bacterium]|nr:UvrD-helicase domain-containing protein [Oscillospiraceae bacterium]